MAPKRQRLSVDDFSFAAPQAWDTAKFISEEAWKQYKNSLAQRNLIPKRGLRHDKIKDGELAAKILGRQWVHFTKPPESAIVSMVREFYTNASAKGPAVVQVRGRSLAFGS